MHCPPSGPNEGNFKWMVQSAVSPYHISCCLLYAFFVVLGARVASRYQCNLTQRLTGKVRIEK